MRHYHLYNQTPAGIVTIVATRQNRATLRDYMLTRNRHGEYEPGSWQFIRECGVVNCALREQGQADLRYRLNEPLQRRPPLGGRQKRRNSSERRKRDALIYHRNRNGESAADIARTVGLSAVRVRDIIADEKKRRKAIVEKANAGTEQKGI